jgi:hypothetical protein
MFFHIGRCKLCDSPLRNEIEKAILSPNRKPYIKIQEEFNVGYKTLKKHINEHMSQEAANAILSRPLVKNQKKIEVEKVFPSVNNVLESIEFIQGETFEIYTEAKEEKKVGIQLAALKQAANNIEMVIRANEIIMDASSQQGWQAIIPKILKAVDKYPEAKTAISIAMRQIKTKKDPEKITWVNSTKN